MTNPSTCQSYYDDQNQLQNCSCGKCAKDQPVDEQLNRILDYIDGCTKYPDMQGGNAYPLFKSQREIVFNDIKALIQAECNRARKEGKVELINRILGTNAEIHQDIPHWLIEALFKIRTELQQLMKVAPSNEKEDL